jgi:hypothetical protein
MTTQCAHLLAGGCAPQRWRRSTAAAASRLRTLAIRSAWPNRFAQVAPQLNEGPLFGRALADAVAQLGAARDDADESAPRRRSAPADLPRAGERRPAFPPFARPAPNRVPSPAMLKHRARGVPTLPAVAMRRPVGARPSAPDARSTPALDAPAVDPSGRARATNGSSVVGDTASAKRALPAANQASEAVVAAPVVPEALAFPPTAPHALLERLVLRDSVAGQPAKGSRAESARALSRAERPREPPMMGRANRAGSTLRANDRVASARPAADAGLLPHSAHAAPRFTPRPAPATRFRNVRGNAAFDMSDVAATAFAAPSLATSSLRARILARASALDSQERSRAAGSSDTSVERDWGRSPLGPAAPAALLEHLASASTGASSTRPAAPARTVRAAPRGTLPDETRAHAAARGASYDALRTNRTARSASHDGPPVHDAPHAGAIAEAPPVAAPSAAAPAFPPLGDAPSLPPFEWARAFAAPALAAATAPASERATAPARDDEDDLDLLSAKIERILLEQARRNGIDV